MQLFTAKYDEILKKVDSINPVKYSVTRNFKNGHVTKLSPYISRGVISTRFIYEKLVEKGFNLKKCEKFIQELAWRDFWQQIWVAKGFLINEDLKRPQEDVNDYKISESLVQAKTGINSVDDEINNLYDNGYMHNHMRMYVASIATNIAKSHWKNPAKWMYYHLLDGDWASNALSWQWVAGSNSNKKYYANQANINKYFESNQINNFLDKINNEDPVEITSKKATRYFMTVLEACYLVLKTVTINSKGNTFILNMGKPTNILNLAKNLAKIKVKTNRSYRFEYKEIGLKPGEKLKETLKDKNEILKKISKEIFMVQNKNKNIYKFEFYFEKLKNNFFSAKKNKLIIELKNIVKFC